MKKGNYGKLIILVVIALNVWFADRVLTLLESGVPEPITLIGAWFTWTVGELLIIAKIKKVKVDNNV